MRPSILRALSCSLAFSFASVAQAEAPSLDELARTTALTAADDYRIGKGYMDMVGWMYGTVEDPEVLAQVEATTRRIVAASDRPDMVFNIVVVPDPTVNAAALPGGFLLVHQGLLDTLSEDEVAFVIAHEVSHVQLRHFATSMNMTGALEVLERGELARATDDRSGVGSASEELSRMSTHYSRTLELEADLYGLLYAMRAGYPAQAGIDAMETMKLAVGEVPEWMQAEASHPTFSQRVSELRSGMETVQETHRLFDAGVGYARAGEYEAAIPAFQQFLTLFPQSSSGWSNLGTCYLHEALKSADADPWHDDLPLYVRPDVTVRAGLDPVLLERARDALSRALKLDPNRDAAWGNLGVLARLEGQVETAQELLDKARELDPDYAGYLNNLGNVAATAGDLKKADRLWGKAIAADPSASYAVANRARGLVLRGKKRPAIALWEQLLEDRSHGKEAHEELVALGVRDASTPRPESPVLEPREDEGQVVVELKPPADPPPVEPAPSDSEAGVEGEVSVPPTAAGGEKLGNVGLGQSLSELVSILGPADFQDRQQDGFYVYVSWWDYGLSVVLTDDVSTALEIFPPSTIATARGIRVGSTAQELEALLGPPDTVFGEKNGGYEAWTYEAAGSSFYIDSSSTVSSISLWSP